MSFLTLPIICTTLGSYTILNSDLLTRVIGIAVNNITNSLTIMASTSYNNHQLKNYQDDIELLDIEIKLKLVDNWLREINVDSIKPESNLDIIYRGISESCHGISWLTKEINNKINHYNSLWFRNWRTIDLDLEIHKLKRNTKILSERLNLIMIGCMWENMNSHRVTDDSKPPETYNIVDNHYTPGEQ